MDNAHRSLRILERPHTARLFAFFPQNLCPFGVSDATFASLLERATDRNSGGPWRFPQLSRARFASTGRQQRHRAIFRRLGKPHDEALHAKSSVAGRRDLEIRGSEAGCGADGLHTRALRTQLSGERVRKDRIGELRLVVALPARTPQKHRRPVAAEVAPVLTEVLGVQRSSRVPPRARGVHDDACLTAPLSSQLKQREELFGQQEMRQMVGLRGRVTSIVEHIARHMALSTNMCSHAQTLTHDAACQASITFSNNPVDRTCICTS